MRIPKSRAFAITVLKIYCKNIAVYLLEVRRRMAMRKPYHPEKRNPNVLVKALIFVNETKPFFIT